MIKNLLNADEDFPAENLTSEESVVNPAETQPILRDSQPRQVFEIPESAIFFTPPIIPVEEETQQPIFSPIAQKIETPTAKNIESKIPPIHETNREDLYAEMVSEQIELDKEAESAKVTETPVEKPLFQSNYTPETPDETIRKSGMAYSAAIVLLVSIVFMMLLGWFADLLLGSKPFGIVGGIILGAIVGFIQFFRITSSLFK